MDTTIWKVPYINLPQQFNNLENELTAEFKRVMKEGAFILRDDVGVFEKNMADYLGVRNVIGVNSGTDALYLATEALGIGPEDEVITVAHSFVATVASIVKRGAKPVFTDIGDDFNMDITEVEELINKKTKSIIPVHLNGRCCRMDELREIAQRYGLKIIEDVAQALGASYLGKKAGSFGDLGCFSAHPMKILSCAGDGGYISTDNDELAQKIRILRDHGQKSKTDLSSFGYNSRLDNLQAAILNVKFKHLDEYIHRRREIASQYSDRLKDLPIILPPEPSHGKHYDSYNSYVIRSDKRDEMLDHLRSDGIEAFVHISKPLYRHYALGLDMTILPRNEKICNETISLPIYPELTEQQLDYVVSSLHRFSIKSLKGYPDRR